MRLAQTSALYVSLPWQMAELEETQRLMDVDFWSYGMAANRRVLEAAIEYSFEQGLTVRKCGMEELFLASMFDGF